MSLGDTAPVRHPKATPVDGKRQQKRTDMRKPSVLLRVPYNPGWYRQMSWYGEGMHRSSGSKKPVLHRPGSSDRSCGVSGNPEKRRSTLEPVGFRYGKPLTWTLWNDIQGV